MSKLVKLTAMVDERPTLEQTDALLAELSHMPRNPTVTGLIDELLDYRELLARSGT